MENQDLGMLLKTHLNDIQMLRHGDSDTAELLYQRTKMFSEKFFGRTYNVDLIGMKFRVQFPLSENLNALWQLNVPKLNAIAKTMYDDYSLTHLNKPKTISQPQVKYIQVENTQKIEALQKEIAILKALADEKETNKKKFRRRLLFIGLLALLSTILWTFNFAVHWNWLETHQKKVAIYIGLQFLIVVLLIRIIAKNKLIDFATLIGIVFQIITLL